MSYKVDIFINSRSMDYLRISLFERVYLIPQIERYKCSYYISYSLQWFGIGFFLRIHKRK